MHNMNYIDHQYVVVKLISGETLLCVLNDESENSIHIMYPISMKSVRIESGKEVLSGTPWLPYTDDPIFEIYNQDVITIKPMSDNTIQYYKRLVDTSVSDISMRISDQIDDKQEEINDQDLFFITGNNTLN